MDEDPLAPSFFPTAEWVLRRLEQKHDARIADRVLNITLWGSRVYGSATPTSDWDCITVTRYNTAEDMKLIAADPNKMRASRQDQTPEQAKPKTKKSISEIDASLFPIYQDDHINATLIPLEEWIIMVREHRHMALEAVYAPAKFKLLEQHPVGVNLDPDILRRTVLWESTRTFVASGNKLMIPGGFTEYNFYRARKEIVHSFRYLLFAIQLVKKGCIEDFGAANSYLAEIMKENVDGSEAAKMEDADKTSASSAGRKRGARRGDKDNEETNQRWDAVVARFRPIFEQLRQELKDLRDYSHLYGRYNTDRMLFTSMKERRKKISLPEEEPTSTSTQFHEDPIVDNSSLATISFLKRAESLAQGLKELEAKHKVGHCMHTKHSNLVLLNTDIYSIRSWDDATPISLECKGLIVDTRSPQYQAVAYSFPHVQDLSPHVDVVSRTDLLEVNSRWSEVQVTECLDGLTAVLYFYAGEWHLSSKCTINLNSLIEPDVPSTNITWKEDDASLSFNQLFWDAWSACKYELPEDQECCYTFEILSHRHRHLTCVPQPEHDVLILIAARHMPTLRELDPRLVCERYGWMSVPCFSQFTSIEDVQAAARELNPFVCKGFVIVDKSTPARWRRWVVKCPQYVAVQLGTDLTTVGPLNLRADMDEMHMRELLRFHKADEFVSYFPRWSEFAHALKAEYDAMCDRLQEIWEMLLQTPDQRTFAALCKQHGGAGHDFIFFKMRKEGMHVNPSVRQYLAIAEDSIFPKLLQFWSRRPAM